MGKTKKSKRRKTYQFGRNRKRMNRNMKNKVKVKIGCDAINKVWNEKKTTFQNLESMGLCTDVNKKLKNPKFKPADVVLPQVVEEIEADARAPRVKNFRIPKNEAEFLAKLIEKYGEAYKVMARDKTNVEQLTWKQIRAKIKVFKNVPEQYKEYVKDEPEPMEAETQSVQ